MQDTKVDLYSGEIQSLWNPFRDWNVLIMEQKPKQFKDSKPLKPF